MALNVNRQIADPFYRYKMPRLQAKVEGKGNGIKTVIANMSDIAKSLERPPEYPTKYIGCKLGAQTNVDQKNERYIVNGEHDANKLQEILDGFIKEFVLCPACENPETTLRVKKNAIHAKCKACGHSYTIDNRHKLSTFILKNPPKIDIDYEKVKKEANGHVEENGVEDTDRNSSEGADDDDDDWMPEPTNDEKLSGGVGRLVISADLEKSVEERLDMLHKFFVERKKAGGYEDGKDMLHEAERLDLKQKAPLLLVEALLDENIMVQKQLVTLKKLFLRFTVNDKKAQRYLLGGIEQLIMKYESVLMEKAAHIIKALYDNDIVEEESLLAWGDKPSSKYVGKTNSKKIVQQCKAVLDWLREASESESDEDEEDDEIGFEEEKKESVLAKKIQEREEKEIKVYTEEGQELDINDI